MIIRYLDGRFNCLTIGDIYKVVKSDLDMYWIECDDGNIREYYKWRFKIVSNKLIMS